MSEAAGETEVAAAGRPEWALFAGLRGFADALGRALSSEGDRWFLWLPVFLGTGIGIYFSLTVEPPMWLGLTLGGLGILGVALARWCERWVAAVVALAAVATGFATAEIETRLVAAPVLEHPT